MNSLNNKNVRVAPSVPGAGPALPIIDVRFSPVYAWLGIVFGAFFFLFGVVLAVENYHHRNRGIGILISLVSLAAIFASNYWRGHRHIVAQLTPQQLILRRDGALNWSEIVAIDNKAIRMRHHGVGHKSEFVCIKLKNRPPAKNKWDEFFHKAKHAVLGYDIVVGESELSCSAEWFVAECRKRMAAMSA